MILGIADSHNASAALISSDGKLMALQEERPKYIKNYSGFPEEAVLWLLEQHKLKPSDIEVVALASLHQPPDRTREELIFEYRNITSFRSQMKRWLRYTPLFSFKKSLVKKQRIRKLTEIGFKTKQICFCEHHQCHAASAYYGWGKHNEQILVITCDGAGDGLCATVNIGEKGRLQRLYSINWEQSIARLYAVVTYMMGMAPLEHEYKMMGMAPYVKGKNADRIALKLFELFEWDDSGVPVWRRRRGVPHMYYIKPVLKRLFFEERFDTIMAGAQLFIEKMVNEFIRRSIKVTGIKKLALSGGVFMNVKANKKIMELDEVDDLFIFPSCGDETNAIGACYLSAVEQWGIQYIKPLETCYLGPKWDDNLISTVVESAKEKMSLSVECLSNINQKVAKLLAAGEIVARFSGREEFGARSLGNRAILADPRNIEVIKVINEMIKNRDFWMPFAASILDEYADAYLINPKKILSPYMILSFDTTDEGKIKVKAGTHPYDKTCRPQIVTKKHNPDYWDLIKEFSKLTGVGALLNTSLNLHGLPLVHKPEDALDILENSGLRYLAIGSFLLEKIDDDS